ncbi:MAG: hypothetical protein ACRDJM_11425, partial [Actinomycetota bacterium]
VFYSADITIVNPMWRQVFDPTAAARVLDPDHDRLGGCLGAGWIQTSPDDTLLFHAIIGRKPGALGPADPGVPKMVYALDIRSLVAVPPAEWTVENASVCTISERDEVFEGGFEPSCPGATGAVRIDDASSFGGPHWGAIDNFSLAPPGGRISTVTRIAASNYFVARSGINGDHRICMINVGSDGRLSLDSGFRDENSGESCVNFDRMDWPHGAEGSAKPHSMLFITPSS